VVQNFFTSLFNSAIFDFNEGWMHVLGVEIAGAATLRVDLAQAPAGTSNSIEP